MIESAAIPLAAVDWIGGVRIIRSVFPPIDLFEDIADPADWPLLIAAEQKTNPRLMESIGNLDQVPIQRRVTGPGASYLMAPFTHASRDRPGRYSDGSFGVLYVANSFNVALLETVYHHGKFMAATAESPGWTSQFREILVDINASLHDLRNGADQFAALRDPDDYTEPQKMGAGLRRSGSDGVLFPSVRCAGGECVGLFYPDLASNPHQGRHLDYHWDGKRVDLFRDAGTGSVYRIEQEPGG